MKAQYGNYLIDTDTGLVVNKRGTVLRRTNGYVKLRDPTDAKKTIPVHRVVWELVNGVIPPGLVINHINGVKNDNRIANLELVTHSGNTLHAYRLGLRSAQGEDNGRAKLTECQVAEIRSENKSGRALAVKYGVSRRSIRDILKRRKWASLATELSA